MGKPLGELDEKREMHLTYCGFDVLKPLIVFFGFLCHVRRPPLSCVFSPWRDASARIPVMFLCFLSPPIRCHNVRRHQTGYDGGYAPPPSSLRHLSPFFVQLQYTLTPIRTRVVIMQLEPFVRRPQVERRK